MNGRVDSRGMKGMWVGYDVGCTMGLTLGHGAWQIDQPSNGSIWNSYSFQPVGQRMGYSFTDLGAEGCCRSLNALFAITMLGHRNKMGTGLNKLSGICAREIYHQTSNISCTSVGNKIVDHSDVVGASPVNAAPTYLHFRLNTRLQWIGQKQLQDEMRIS